MDVDAIIKEYTEIERMAWFYGRGWLNGNVEFSVYSNHNGYKFGFIKALQMATENGKLMSSIVADVIFCSAIAVKDMYMRSQFEEFYHMWE